VKVSLKRENLARGLAIVGRMVKTRATLPVLGNIMLSTDKGRLKLVATDLEASITSWIGAKIDEEGATTLPARTLIDYVLSTTDETITLTGEGADIIAKSSRYTATIKGVAAEEFPIIPSVSGATPLNIPASKLKAAILATVGAAALDETRPILAGVLLRIKKGAMKVVATDSYRLCEWTIALDDKSHELELVVPARTVSELSRLLPTDETAVAITVGENQAEFRFGEIDFLTRQIEGAFPDYEQIIPTNFVYQFDCEREELTEALKTVYVFARDAGGNIKIAAETGRVEIVAATTQTGAAQAELRVTSHGEPLSVSFNAKYILDALAVIGGETVSVGFAGALNPALISASTSPELKYIVMPLRGE